MPSAAIAHMVTAKKADILKLLARRGCPICSGCHDELERYWFWFFNESYGEASVAAQYIASYGFCPEHTRAIARRGAVWPISVIYDWTLRNTLPALRQARQALGEGERSDGIRFRAFKRQLAAVQPKGRCIICQMVDETATRLVDDLLLVLTHDAETQHRFRAGDGLCMPHFFLALQCAQPDRLVGLRLVFDVQLAQLETLYAELEEYFRKSDYRFANEPRGTEQTAWLRAVQRFAGDTTMLAHGQEEMRDSSNSDS